MASWWKRAAQSLGVSAGSGSWARRVAHHLGATAGQSGEERVARFLGPRASVGSWTRRITDPNVISNLRSAGHALYTTATLTPRYRVDFLQGINLGILTVARSGTAATYWNAAGVLQTAGANTLRMTYHPRGEKLGALLEESRVNRLLYSNDYTNVWWTKSGINAVGNGGVAADGLTWRTVTEDSTNGVHACVGTSVAITAGHTICLILEVKAAARGIVRIRAANSAGTNYAETWFDLARGIFGVPAAGGSGWAVNEQDVVPGRSGAYYIHVRVGTAVDTTAVLSFGPATASGISSYQGDGASGILVAHAELQSGPNINSCFSLIQTSGAAVTRSADRVSHAMSVFPEWTGPKGSVIVHYRNPVIKVASTNVIALGASGDTTKGMVALNGSSNRAGIIKNIRNSSNTSAPTMEARGQVFDDWTTAGCSWQAGSHLLALNGAAAMVPTQSTAIVPPAGGLTTAVMGHQINLGTDTSMLNGCIAWVEYYSEPLSLTQLRDRTAVDLSGRVLAGGGFRNGVNAAGLEYSGTTLPGTHGLDYFNTRQASFNYYATKAVGGLVRVPYKWERAQPALNGALDDTYVGYLEAACDQAAAVGLQVLLDCHNYGRYSISGTLHDIGDGTVNASHLVDFYDKMAARFAGRAGFYGFDLMNEPTSNISFFVYADMIQQCIDVIRTHDIGCWIAVEAQNSSHTLDFSWFGKNLKPVDSSGKLLFSGHLYFDDNQSGVYSGGYAAENAYAYRGYDRLLPLVKYCLARGTPGHIGECGFPSSEQWPVLAFVCQQKMRAAGLAVTWWQAGRAVSQNDKQCLEPADINNPVDHDQWTVITAQ